MDNTIDMSNFERKLKIDDNNIKNLDNMLKVTATDATNVTAKINVSTASATGGATAKLGLRVGNP